LGADSVAMHTHTHTHTDKGHARRLAIHGPVTRKPRQVTGVADEAVSSHDGLQPCDSLRLVDRYSYGGYTGVW